MLSLIRSVGAVSIFDGLMLVHRKPYRIQISEFNQPCGQAKTRPKVALSQLLPRPCPQKEIVSRDTQDHDLDTVG